MLEKRKHKRLKMEHALELARLNADGTADGGVVNADILIFVPQETRGRQLL